MGVAEVYEALGVFFPTLLSISPNAFFNCSILVKWLFKRCCPFISWSSFSDLCSLKTVASASSCDFFTVVLSKSIFCCRDCKQTKTMIMTITTTTRTMMMMMSWLRTGLCLSLPCQNGRYRPPESGLEPFASVSNPEAIPFRVSSKGQEVFYNSLGWQPTDKRRTQVCKLPSSPRPK